jgi:putative xylitol transport system substrate-binding protein
MRLNDVLLCLTTRGNDYQRQQAADAERTAQALGVKLTIIDADNDAINQSQMLLHAIQTKGKRPEAIIFEPVSGTGLPHVARAAVDAGISWVILNRELSYLTELHPAANCFAFGYGSNHNEIGRIQAAQVGALVPEGGEVLLIEGPSDNLAAKQRTDGFLEKKPMKITVKQLKGKWSEDSGFQAISSWLRLSTSHLSNVRAVVAQNDDMAMGARKAFEEVSSTAERDKWVKTPFIGVDGLPSTGQVWVKSGKLTATVVVPPNSGVALKALADAVAGGVRPPQYTYTSPQSLPEIAKLMMLPK